MSTLPVIDIGENALRELARHFLSTHDIVSASRDDTAVPLNREGEEEVMA